MALPEEKVTVEVLKAGRWAQEPWLPQLEVAKGDKVSISISIAYRLHEKGKCIIVATEAMPEKRQHKVAKQIKKKSEKDPVKRDKKAAES